MGHAVNTVFLNAKNKDQAMKEGYAYAEEWAMYNGDREEGSDNYHGNFRFYDRIFNTEEEAEEFFDSLGSYCDGVCLVKQPTKSAQTKYAKIQERVYKKRQEMKEKAIEKYKERTSASTTCKKCHTKITKEVALKNRLLCPNCRNWLVSDSYKEKYNKLDEALEVAKKQLNKSAEDDGKAKYFAKFEVHC